MKLVMQVGLGPDHIVLDGDTAPPQYSADVCGILIRLCTEVGLGPGDIVLDGDSASPLKGAQPCRSPNFRPMSVVAQWLDYLDATWHGGRPRPRQLCVGWGVGDPAALPKRGHSPPPVFGPCLMWPNGWMDQDATW